MTGFLTEFGKRLAERWLSTLVLPGLLYAAAIVVAVTGSGRHWSTHWLTKATQVATDAGISTSTATLGVLVAVALLVAAGSTLLARALSVPIQRLWTDEWPRWAGGISRRLMRRRQRQHRPTWIGERLLSTDQRIWQWYGLELASSWPRLWLVIPDSARSAADASQERFTAATTLGGWSLLYLLLGFVWWPAFVSGTMIGLVTWRRGRITAQTLAELVESIVDLHAADLAAALHVPIQDGRLNPRTGQDISNRLSKGFQKSD
jgi:hypothetical protein